MPSRTDSSATWHTRASSPNDRLLPSIQNSIAPKTAAAILRAATATRNSSSGVGSCPRSAVQLRACRRVWMASAKSAWT